MKGRLAVGSVVALVLLTSCTSIMPKVQGVVIDCAAIAQEKPWVGGTSLECLDGSEGAQLGALRGPMVINVWGSWCGPCKKEIPYFVAFNKKALGKVALIGVDVEEANAKDGQRFVEENGVTWPNLYDPDGRSRQYFGMGVPVTWFIAPDGSVAYKKIGEISGEKELIDLTEKYLGIKL